MRPCRLILVLSAAALLPACTNPDSAVGFHEQNPAARLRAIRQAAATEDAAAIPDLIDLLESDDPAERLLSIRSLERITHQTLGYDHAAPLEQRREAVRRWSAWYAQQAKAPIPPAPTGRAAAMSTTNQPPQTPSTRTPQLRIELRSNPLFLSGVRELVVAVTRRLGFTEDSSGQIALAVDEALCNVIRHGYKKHPDRPIWLSLWAEGGAWSDGPPAPTGGVGDERPDAVRIVIEDEAQQVDPALIRSRDLDEIRPGGLGVHIIKTIMDEASYEKRGGGGGGMRLTMMKKRVNSTGGDPNSPGGGCGCSDGKSGTEKCNG